MLKKDSIYALNKADSDAIVYIDADGKTIRLTRQNFATAEEFEKWKAWSDENFHIEEKRNHVYHNHTLRLSGLVSTTSFLNSGVYRLFGTPFGIVKHPTC